MQWTRDERLVVPNPDDPNTELLSGKELAFESDVRYETDRLVVTEMAYSFAGHRFAMKRDEHDTGYQLDTDYGLVRSPGRPWPLQGPLKCYGFPDQIKTRFQNAEFLSDLQLAFEEFFTHLYYLGPLREYPKRDYAWTGTEPADVGLRGERVVHALLAAEKRGDRIGARRGSKTLVQCIAYWLKELGLIHDFSLDPIARDSNYYRVRVQKSPTSAKVLITDVGFGVSQILPVLVLCYYVPVGSTILLEQPEIHLHPSAQAALADVFIDAIKKRHVQIILESHSEHLLRRLQRRVAEQKLAPEDIALYFCDMQDGKSKLNPLRMDLFGNVENWPKDFFGDQFGEIFAATKAARKRKAAEVR